MKPLFRVFSQKLVPRSRVDFIRNAFLRLINKNHPFVLTQLRDFPIDRQRPSEIRPLHQCLWIKGRQDPSRGSESNSPMSFWGLVKQTTDTALFVLRRRRLCLIALRETTLGLQVSFKGAWCHDKRMNFAKSLLETNKENPKHTPGRSFILKSLNVQRFN